MLEPIPSPPSYPFIGNLLDLQDEVPMRALERLADTYGPIFKLTIHGNETVFIANQELSEELCDETRFCKALSPALASLNKKGRPMSLFTSNHESDPDWGLAHRILMPAFGPLAVQEMFDEMHDIASQLVLKWARQGPEHRILVTDDFTRLTLDTIALSAMDFRFNSFYQDQLHPFVIAMNNTLGGAQGSSKLSIAGLYGAVTGQTAEFREKNSKIQQDITTQMVRDRHENPLDKKDLLNSMIFGKDPKTGEKMSEALISVNMVAFLIAGHETTSGLLSFVFLNLLKNPATYQAAQQEIDRVAGKSKICAGHLKDLKYIDAVLKETLRLFPTAPAFARRIRPESKEKEPTLGHGRYSIGRDQRVVNFTVKVHRDPKVYGEDVSEFKPERMLDGGFEALPKAAWKPFGTGLRACIGRAFAMQEALLVVALLLQNFNFRMDDPTYEVRIKQALTIKPKDFYMRATLRKDITPTSLQERLAGSFAPLKGHPSDWANTFQRIPTLVDDILEKGGGERLVTRGISDASKGDMFGDFDSWVDQSFWPSIMSHSTTASKVQPESTPTVEMEMSTQDRAASLRQDVRPAKVLSAYLLTAPGEPEKRHLEVLLPSDMAYETGNYLAVLPINPETNVERAMSRFSILWDAVINIKSGGSTTLPVNQPLLAVELLRGYVELGQPVTKKDIRQLTSLCTDPSTTAELTHLATDSTFATEIFSKRTSLLDLATRFPTLPLPFSTFLALLPPMRLRHYSISSSPLASPDRCTITYSVINEPSHSTSGQQFKGVASTYLSSLRVDDEIQVSIRSTSKSFHLPMDVERTPILMVCAGTGLAPFRGFVQERAAQLSVGRNLAPATLFIGCRSATRDRLYGAEIDAWVKAGVVDVRYAFNQTQEQQQNGKVHEPGKDNSSAATGCKYVQDRMARDKADIYDMWDRGAKIFVCGSRRLADGVGQTMKEMVVQRAWRDKGREANEEELRKWVEGVKGTRYVTDVFA